MGKTCNVEPSNIAELKKDEKCWRKFQRGGVTGYMEIRKGNNRVITNMILNGWEGDYVKVGSIIIEFSIEAISKDIDMQMERRLLRRNEKEKRRRNQCIL